METWRSTVCRLLLARKGRGALSGHELEGQEAKVIRVCVGFCFFFLSKTRRSLNMFKCCREQAR